MSTESLPFTAGPLPKPVVDAFPPAPAPRPAPCATCGQDVPSTDLVRPRRAGIKPVCRFCLEVLVASTRMARVPR